LIKKYSNKPLAAISYASTTFSDIAYFVSCEKEVLERVDPDEFIKNPSDEYQYINLITDVKKRKEVSELLDKHELLRFSYVHDSSVTTDAIFSPGAVIYPFCTFYTGVNVSNDVLLHGYVGVAHNVTIGKGTFIGGSTVVAGSTTIGDFCWIGTRVTFFDKVKICNNVIVGASTTVRKDISEPGMYSTVSNPLVKIK
jgi:acyl-[acyl carrier protein]--UDP-N-acetylglucosamine O-acyltransferase